MTTTSINKKGFLVIYIAIACAEMFTRYHTDFDLLHLLIKASLLASLFVYVWQSTQAPLSLQIKLFLVSLAFAWMGDVLLAMDGSPLYFIIGLGAFLLMQIGYSIVFRKSCKNLLFSNFAIKSIPFLFYGIIFILILWGSLATDMKIPVVVYAMAICIMGRMAYERKGQVSENSFVWVMLGALSFIMSDSCLAYNKFVASVDIIEWLVMPTYVAGQYLIVEGMLKEWE
jgi:uncharacterized membrane protein YhhN